MWVISIILTVELCEGRQMEPSQKIQTTLSSHKWYHATTKSNYENLIKSGVIADYNRGNELDFGFGFYLTNTSEMAEKYISRLFASLPEDEPEILVIMEYDFCPLDWFLMDDYKSKVFTKFDDEFAEFVFKNRLESATQKQQHEYDVIYGVMSDSVPTKLLLDFKAGETSKESVLDGLKKSTSMKQISIHNQSLCDTLKLTRAYEFYPKTDERKELAF